MKIHGRRALRELYEETSIRSVERLGEINDWLSYDIPRAIVGQAWGGRYRGQTQKWYALRFAGDDSEINISSPGSGVHDPEFIAWKWEPMARLPDLVVPFSDRPMDGWCRNLQSSQVDVGATLISAKLSVFYVRVDSIGVIARLDRAMRGRVSREVRSP
jgi:hypothetical protein